MVDSPFYDRLPTKVGLSLSFCIKDMIRKGVKDTNDVAFIVASTECENEEEFEKAVEHYAENYWQKDPALGVRLAYNLWDEEKIFQPKLEQPEPMARIMPDWHRMLRGQGAIWMTIEGK